MKCWLDTRRDQKSANLGNIRHQCRIGSRRICSAPSSTMRRRSTMSTFAARQPTSATCEIKSVQNTQKQVYLILKILCFHNKFTQMEAFITFCAIRIKRFSSFFCRTQGTCVSIVNFEDCVRMYAVFCCKSYGSLSVKISSGN